MRRTQRSALFANVPPLASFIIILILHFGPLSRQGSCQGARVLVTGGDLNQRPSGYEPDKLPRLLAPRVSVNSRPLYHCATLDCLRRYILLSQYGTASGSFTITLAKISGIPPQI